MARGWESKSVEAQMEERREERDDSRTPRSAEQLEKERQRYSLELSRRRIASELAGTQSALRRPSLEAALKHLDGELSKLS
jgi:hypothetical protein